MRFADALSLAAAPTFAGMAALTAMPGQEPMASVCGGGHAALLTGMVPMYVLMSAFHLAPWIRLVERSR